MYFVKKIGKSLDLIDEYPTSWGYSPKLVREERDIGQIRLVERFTDKLDRIGVGILMPDPSSFSRTPRTEKKDWKVLL